MRRQNREVLLLSPLSNVMGVASECVKPWPVKKNGCYLVH